MKIDNDKRFIGSSLAIFLGLVSIGASMSNHTDNYLVSGYVLIFGALAYRSAKKRKLGLVDYSTRRVVLELVAITLIILSVLFSSRTNLVNDPFPTLVIPIWVILAYIVTATNKSIVENR